MAGAAAAFLALAGFSSAASAVAFQGGYTITSSNAGLQVWTTPLADSLALELSEGDDPYSVDLFGIWTGLWDWTDGPADISVDFGFKAPESSGSVDGTIDGNRFLGFFTDGSVTWGEPRVLEFGNGGELQISLSDVEFKPGYFDDFDFLGWPVPDGSFGGIVTAEFEILKDSGVISTPLPAALPLLLSAFGGLFLLGRRRNAAGA
ncbi:MAG TPA: hypothetical protein VFJ13_08435 [Paracoccaceae bacterium]|nr:hypothetical protein [Paracoccaceae bacterium]